MSKDTEKRTHNGIVFDSVMEMKYYRDVVLPLEESGQITHYELQKPYELQPKFTHDNKNVRPIVYVADFYIEYADGTNEIIDIKGTADSIAKLKRKMMWFQYPETPYRWITYIKKLGGWVEYDIVCEYRKEAKKAKKAVQQKEEEDSNEQV